MRKEKEGIGGMEEEYYNERTMRGGEEVRGERGREGYGVSYEKQPPVQQTNYIRDFLAAEQHTDDPRRSAHVAACHLRPGSALNRTLNRQKSIISFKRLLLVVFFISTCITFSYFTILSKHGGRYKACYAYQGVHTGTVILLEQNVLGGGGHQ